MYNTYTLQQPRENPKTLGLVAFLRCIFNSLENIKKKKNIEPKCQPRACNKIDLILVPCSSAVTGFFGFFFFFSSGFTSTCNPSSYDRLRFVRIHSSDILENLGIFVQDVATLTQGEKSARDWSSLLFCIRVGQTSSTRVSFLLF